MRARLHAQTVKPQAIARMLNLEEYIASSEIERGLVHLIKLRASQINGCAFCIEMHTRHALEEGERPERLLLLSAWAETGAYTPRERAALGWTEALTRIADHPDLDAPYAALQAQLTPGEIVDLTLVITTINAWNRIAIGLAQPTTTRPPAPARQEPASA